jgi:SPP1 family predicted phage head-tail adaptor
VRALFKEIIDLISVTETETDAGGFQESKTARQVFADKRSVRQSEFYQAASTGLKPEIVFVIRRIDYEDERLLAYKGLEYSVIRTFEAKDEMIELVATRTVKRAGES